MDLMAMNACLDAAYGTTRAAHCPSSHDLALFYGDPKFGGVEISGGGYARAAVSAADWEPAEDGQKSTLNWVQFPEPTDEWSSEATHWGLYDEDDNLWDSGPFSDSLVITGPGAGPLVRVTVRFADSIIPEED